MNFIFLTFIEVWMQWVSCKVNLTPFRRHLLCMWAIACQKNEIYFLIENLITEDFNIHVKHLLLYNWPRKTLCIVDFNLCRWVADHKIVKYRTCMNKWINTNNELRLLLDVTEQGTIQFIQYEPHHEKTCLCHMQTIKVQISLRIRAVWSVPLLFAASS